MAIPHRTPQPASRPLAFMSDIHGNLPALDAVLAELGGRAVAVTDVLVAGDLVFGGDQPLEVWHRLQQIGARCTRGLSDMALATLDPKRLAPVSDREREQAARFAATRAALGEIVVARLRRLPEQLRLPLLDGGELLMVHGSPRDPSCELSHDLGEVELSELLDGDPADIVVCGASHVPFDRDAPGVRVVNVGSVGAAPEGPVAHYTVITPRADRTDVEQTWVVYSE